MIGFILNAVIQEAKQFLLSEDVGAQLITRTNFKSGKVNIDKNIPLVLLDLNEAQDSYQLIGGLTMCGWKWSFNSYAYMPDAYNDDPSGYSAELLYDPIDTIRRHFSLGPLGQGLVFETGTLISGKIYQVALGTIIYDGDVFTPGTFFTCNDLVTTFTTSNGGYCIGTSWMTQGMVDVFNQYGFCFTLSGITAAEQIDESGLLLGYGIEFESVSLDGKTLFTEDDIILETITELPLGPQWILFNGFWNDSFAGYECIWVDIQPWNDAPPTNQIS